MNKFDPFPVEGPRRLCKLEKSRRSVKKRVLGGRRQPGDGAEGNSIDAEWK
jgi:hypothetical protein